MPNRILRAELLDSEPWLSLKDNADRVCWIACFLTCDTFGNLPAGMLRLTRLWSPFGVDSVAKAAKVLSELCDVDLIRRYDVGGKPYLHLPRFGQSRRFLGKLWPLSPWTTDEEKERLAQKTRTDSNCLPDTNQQVTEKSLVKHGESPEGSCDPPRGVGVGVGVGVDVEVPSTSKSSKPKAKSKALRPPPAEKPAGGVAAELPTVAVWAAYSTAYFDRYGTPPVRNATVNGQLANLVARLGKEEAPPIATFYVQRNDQRYSKARHSVGLLLHDCEALRMEWATGRSTPASKLNPFVKILQERSNDDKG